MTDIYNYLSFQNIIEIFKPDRHWEKVYRIHQKARTHSYVNICWMIFCGTATLYFTRIWLFVEPDVKCISARLMSEQNGVRFLRFDSV